MRFASKVLLLAATAILAMGPMEAAAVSDLAERKAAAARLLAAGPIESRLGSWKAVLATVEPGTECKCAPGERNAAAWSAALHQRFDTRALLADLGSRLAERLTRQDLSALERMFASRTGRRVTAVERAYAGAHAAPRRIEQQFAEVARARRRLDAEPRRKAVLAEVVAANGGVKAHADVLLAMEIGLLEGSYAALPGGLATVDVDALRKKIEQGRPATEAYLAAILVPLTEIVLAPLSLDELTRYRALLRAPAMGRFVELVNAWTNEALRASAAAVGEQFARETRRAQDL